MDENPIIPEPVPQIPKVSPYARAKPADCRPVAVPQIPRGPLWVALAVPPGLTLAANMAIGLSSKNGGDGGLSLLIPPIMFFVIVGFCIQFNLLMKLRYRRTSLFYLNFAYFAGQIIVCLTLWIGSCALFFAPMH